MAGWLVAWSVTDEPLRQAVWDRAVVCATATDDVTIERDITPRIAVAAWRRATGEFAHSGQLVQDADRRVAWVGQTLADAGDTSEATIEMLSCATDPQVAADMNGHFAAAVVERDSGRVTLWSDRHNHYPIYVYRGARCGAASTLLAGVLPFVEQRSLSLSAADVLLRTGELIGDATLLSDVVILPAGTRATAAAGRWETQRYWRIQFEPDPRMGFDDAVERVSETLGRAVQRVEDANPRLGITLSGGLDSRLLLATCRHPQRVPSFTWGLPGCRDITCAAAVAQAVGSPHHVRHWEPDAFVARWSDGVRHASGGFGIHEMHMLPFVGLLAEHCDVVLNGLAGDVLLGGNFVKSGWLAQSDLGALAAETWRWRVRADVDARVDRVMAGHRDRGAACRAWCDAMETVPGHGANARLHTWLFENRVFRFTNCGTFLLRAGVESQSPFFDRDVVDAICAIPLAYKLKHRLYLPVLRRLSPATANVPWQRTMLAPARGYHANLAALAAHRLMRIACKPLKIDPFPRLAVTDTAGWMRGPWREPLAEVILSERALSRGLFNPDGVRALWEAHQSGGNYTTQLGVLMTIELFARWAVDGDGWATADTALEAAGQTK